MSEPVLRGNESKYVNDCLAHGWISASGKYVEAFESSWAEYCGVRHGVAVSSGTAALQVAVDCLRIGQGDEVILPSFTIISCALAIVRAGATPVLVDCDPETFCLDLNAVEAAITPRTRAIMPVHMYGHPVQMDELARIAAARGIAIIEDAAQAHGSEYLSQRSGKFQWERCGSFGTISTFSFFANKLVSTGEGGMLLTNDPLLAERARALRNLFFREPRFEHEEAGYNYRITNIQSAVGLAQVEGIQFILDQKNAIAASYTRQLGGLRTLQLPVQREWARSNHWVYAIVLTDDSDMDAVAFAEQLKSRGIETRPFFVGMHRQPVLLKRGFTTRAEYPVTDRIRKMGVYLPSGAGLSDQQINTVCEAVRETLE